MKKINLEEINMVNRDKEWLERRIKEAEQGKARKRSENGIKKAEKEINDLLEYKAKDEKKLNLLEEEAKEAEKLIEQGYEIILVKKWLDEYGRLEGGVIREKAKNLDEAKETYTKLKKENGGYISITIEVREQGTQEKIEKLQKEIEEKQKELANLLKG